MRQSILTILLLCSGILAAQASDFYKVYQIFQWHCVSCHNSANPQGSLNLEGAGSTLSAKMTSVMSQLLMVNPTNATAAAKGYKRVYPGRADRSFLFHKVNGPLDSYYSLSAGEGDVMPMGSNNMTLRERELIRQWILAGAEQNSSKINHAALDLYFSGQGLNAFDTPPPPPISGQGFQIKMGPFYLEPGGEVEYYQKWELFNTTAFEVPRIDMKLSDFSHHLLIYHFTDATFANAVPHGLRTAALHNGIGLTAAVQEATNLNLPPKTAFVWPVNRVLDLNSHYINYSQSAAYRCEVYINVYTQPSGTAIQPMETSLYAHTSIFIPNNGDLITHSANIVSPIPFKVWVWSLMGHTHKYGVGFKIGQLVNNQIGELYYDGACPQGVPGCPSPYFDYRHIPLRMFEPLKEVNMQQGVRWQAQWINDGPAPVNFGPTSDDEMMVMVAMFVQDTTGLNLDLTDVSDAHRPTCTLLPNPFSDRIVVALNGGGPVLVRVTDLQGREVVRKSCFAGDVIDTDTWMPGVYTVLLQTGDADIKQRLLKIP